MINFSKGFLDYLAAGGKIGKYGLWSYVIVTTVTSLVLGFLLFGTIFTFGDEAGSLILSILPAEWGGHIVQGVVDWVSRVLLWTVAFFLFKYIIIIVLSPVMSLISAKIEKQKTGKVASRFTLIGELIRGLRFNLRLIFRELIFILLFFILSLIPGVGFITPFILFFIQAYFAGLGVMDYYLERHYSISESMAVGSENKFYLTGLGSGFLLTIMIPVAGIMFAPILGTIAATEYACKDKMALV